MEYPVVLLVNPHRMRPPIGPIGLEYVAAALERCGYSVHLCDLTFAEDWRVALKDAMDATQPLAVGVSVRNLDDAYFVSQDFILERTAEIIRYIPQLTRAPVVLGGVGFSLAPEAVLRFTGADYGIVGDGEYAFPQLLGCLAMGGDLREVRGAVYRREDGGIEANVPASCDPDLVCFSSRRFADNPRYFREGGQAGVETKRGCKNPCVYCVEPEAKGRQMRLRNPECVVKEVEELLGQGIDVIHLCDSEFNLPASHAHAVCAALDRHGLGRRVRWYAYAYPVPFDESLARSMSRAGCVGINFGVDHCDAAMLRRLGRTYSAEDVRNTARACRDSGMAVMFDMLFGGPGETRETLRSAVETIQALEVDRVGLSCGLRVYPNTPLAGMVRRLGPVASNPHLHGTREDNEDFLRPIFFIDAALGLDLHGCVSELVDGDARFLHADPSRMDGNYNYNDNSVLCDAISAGERGAYWDILRRLERKANVNAPER